MFVDASAIVAILTREPEAAQLADLLESAKTPITSAVAVFEAALGLCRKRHASVAEAHAGLADFLTITGITAFLPCSANRTAALPTAYA